MDYRPMFEAIRTGVSVPEEYAAHLIIGRTFEKEIIENDIDYVISYQASKIRIFLGDYGFGKTTLAKYAITRASEKGMVYSMLTEKDYKSIYRQDEFFRSIMKNLRMVGFQGDLLRFILNNWAEQFLKENKDSLETLERDQIVAYLKSSNQLFDGFFADVCGAYLYNYINEKSNNELLAFIRGDKVPKRTLRDYGITHFLEDDGWNFLDAFMKLLLTFGIKGLLLVMDELENLRQNRKDIRDKIYNHLRELLDKLPGGEIKAINCIWLGTREWFDDQERGIKSYTALYDRIQKEVSGVQTKESTLVELKPMSTDDLNKLVEKVSGMYKETYNITLSQKQINTIKSTATQQFTNINGEVSVAPRRVIKWLTELLDVFKEGNKDIINAINSVSKSVEVDDDRYSSIF